MNLLVKDFPEELHYQARVQAAVERIPLKVLVYKAISEYLQRAEKKETKKK